MNYLGHAVLSFGDSQILVGNMIADHVKGKLALEKFPLRVKEGILCHRKIDAFTDQHPATKRAMLWFREDFGLYSGAIVDSLYDHFLANDPKYFTSEQALLQFSEKTYAQIGDQVAIFPTIFGQYFPYMRQQNWLYNYRTLAGVQKSLQGLHRRAKYMPSPEKAYQLFIAHYYQLAQCYYDFFDEAAYFVKATLAI